MTPAVAAIAAGLFVFACAALIVAIVLEERDSKKRAESMKATLRDAAERERKAAERER